MTYDRIKKSFTGLYHAHSWSYDPTAAGAFAHFGPSQFNNLNPYLTRPAAHSMFHIVGEAVRTHHAWLAGAIDSAYAAVYRVLLRFRLFHAIEPLEKQWSKVEELETGELQRSI